MGNCLSSSSAATASPVIVDQDKDASRRTEEETKPPQHDDEDFKNNTARQARMEQMSSVVTSMRDPKTGLEVLGAEDDRNTLEDLDYCDYPSSLQEELNEMLEAVYALISEEDIQSYQRYLQGIQKQQIAEQAAKALSPAPGFELMDQDNERVSLEALCEKGPVVLQFYRGKWCPHCNAGLMAYNKFFSQIRDKGATFIAISPMLPDGSQFLASKRDLQFAVLSDCGNTVARDYKVTFVVPEDIRPTFEAWGHDVAAANGDDLWEVPLAATYIINQQQQIVWSFVDNDHGCWAEPADVVKALDTFCGPESAAPTESAPSMNTNSATRGKGSVPAQKPSKDTFGPKKQAAMDFVSGYPS